MNVIEEIDKICARYITDVIKYRNDPYQLRIILKDAALDGYQAGYRDCNSSWIENLRGAETSPKDYEDAVKTETIGLSVVSAEKFDETTERR
jgi:hypothetical protein